MAEYSNPTQPGLNTPTFANEHNSANIPGQIVTLPTGPCKFHESGQQCGCRQYFNETFGRSGSGSLYFCMCSHHACFHEQGDSVSERASSQFLRSQDARSRSGYEDRRPHGNAFGRSDSDPFGHKDAPNTKVGSQGSHRTFSHMQNSLPDTLPWSTHTSAGPSQSGQPTTLTLPPIPSQCLFSSQERIDRENAIEGTQTTASVVLSEKRAFADIRANSFLPVQKKNPQPSNAAEPQGDAGAQGSSYNADRGHEERTAGSETDTESLSQADVHRRYSSPIRSVRRDLTNLSTVVQAHEERIGFLENVSFSHTDEFEVQGQLQERQGNIEERFENVEIRQDELDGRIVELEKSRDNESSVAQSAAGESFTSFVTNTASTEAALLSLQAQIAELQAERPTPERPWMVEVVFLPFGSLLKGIWSTIEQFPSQSSRRNSMAADDWVQSQLPSQSEKDTHPGVGSWEGIIEKQRRGHVDFLVARSCNQKSMIYERLQSRGCVRMISIRGPSFKDVDTALHESLGDIPGILSKSDIGEVSKRCSRLKKTYHSLQSSWIPLRKLHKDSRLRFLDPPELVSQALWTVDFLKSSVVMRAAEHPILFITQPSGYTQHLSNLESQWTWPKLRILPRVDVETAETEVKEADACEPCWRFDDRFDTFESIQSSFTSEHSLSIRQAPEEGLQNLVSCSDHFSSAAASPLGTPTASEARAPLEESHSRSRSKLRRTASVPMLMPLQERQSLSKRKTSYYPDLHSKSASQHATTNLNQKRRRISRSPSRPRNTPRWSVGPHDFEDFGTEPPSARGTTPFAYATPHSNDYAEFRVYDDEDDDEDYDEGSTTQNGGFDAAMQGLESSFEGITADEHWEGVEDGSNDNDDNDSDSSDSDAPSEYPSTQPPIAYGRSGPFTLCVDEENDYNASRREQ